jgi:tetratricopeptide (TPR) repeat protein
MTADTYSEGIAEARERGDEYATAQLLIEAIESTPLFTDNIVTVEEWLFEAGELGNRTVLRPDQDVLQLVRRSELFLASGLASEALESAAHACSRAKAKGLSGLEDRVLMVEARALVRVRRQEDAIHLFETMRERQTPDDSDDDLMPGLAYLAVGEAQLFEERYDGAYRPLELAIQLLPVGGAADRLRFDALVGLGMLDHRMGEFETASLRFKSAMELADQHTSRSEQVESYLLLGSLCRSQGQTKEAHAFLKKAQKVAAQLAPFPHHFSFPAERLRNLVGCQDREELVSSAIALASECGASGDLMGYVQITAIVAALCDLQGDNKRAVAILKQVSASLKQGGQSDASLVLEKHLAGYE